MLLDDIDEILIPAEALAARVRELGKQISNDYEGKEPLLVGILTGAVLFMSDLLRAITIPCQLDFMATSSYGDRTDSTGVVRILKDLDQPIVGRHVIVVDDIIDTGLTMDYLLESLKTRYPASLRVCALLDKVPRRLRYVPIDYRGFEIPDKFVVGYGLDYAGLYRNLPFICVLKPQIYGQEMIGGREGTALREGSSRQDARHGAPRPLDEARDRQGSPRHGSGQAGQAAQAETAETTHTAR